MKGKCHCGEVSFEASGEKQFEFLCHCVDCRVINGGGHLAGVIFKKDLFQVTGEPKQYVYPGGEGDIESYFCSNCGTPLYAYLGAHPNVVVVRANALEDGKGYSPKKSLFKEAAFPWDTGVIR